MLSADPVSSNKRRRPSAPHELSLTEVAEGVTTKSPPRKVSRHSIAATLPAVDQTTTDADNLAQNTRQQSGFPLEQNKTVDNLAPSRPSSLYIPPFRQQNMTLRRDEREAAENRGTWKDNIKWYVPAPPSQRVDNTRATPRLTADEWKKSMSSIRLFGDQAKPTIGNVMSRLDSGLPLPTIHPIPVPSPVLPPTTALPPSSFYSSLPTVAPPPPPPPPPPPAKPKRAKKPARPGPASKPYEYAPRPAGSKRQGGAPPKPTYSSQANRILEVKPYVYNPQPSRGSQGEGFYDMSQEQFTPYDEFPSNAHPDYLATHPSLYSNPLSDIYPSELNAGYSSVVNPFAPTDDSSNHQYADAPRTNGHYDTTAIATEPSTNPLSSSTSQLESEILNNPDSLVKVPAKAPKKPRKSRAKSKPVAAPNSDAEEMDSASPPSFDDSIQRTTSTAAEDLDLNILSRPKRNHVKPKRILESDSGSEEFDFEQEMAAEDEYAEDEVVEQEDDMFVDGEEEYDWDSKKAPLDKPPSPPKVVESLPAPVPAPILALPTPISQPPVVPPVEFVPASVFPSVLVKKPVPKISPAKVKPPSKSPSSPDSALTDLSSDEKILPNNSPIATVDPATRLALLVELAQPYMLAKTNSQRDRMRAEFVHAWLLDSYELSGGGNVCRPAMYKSYTLSSTSAGVDDHINSASFGKAIRAAFPKIEVRRLGHRGNSTYHYTGIRASHNIEQAIIDKINEEDYGELTAAEKEKDKEKAKKYAKAVAARQASPVDPKKSSRLSGGVPLTDAEILEEQLRLQNMPPEVLGRGNRAGKGSNMVMSVKRKSGTKKKERKAPRSQTSSEIEENTNFTILVNSDPSALIAIYHQSSADAPATLLRPLSVYRSSTTTDSLTKLAFHVPTMINKPVDGLLSLEYTPTEPNGAHSEAERKTTNVLLKLGDGKLGLEIDSKRRFAWNTEHGGRMRLLSKGEEL